MVSTACTRATSVPVGRFFYCTLRHGCGCPRLRGLPGRGRSAGGFDAQERDAGEAQFRECRPGRGGRLADTKAERARGFDQRNQGVGRRELLQDQRRVKWNALQLAQAAKQPHHLLAPELRLHSCPRPTASLSLRMSPDWSLRQQCGKALTFAIEPESGAAAHMRNGLGSLHTCPAAVYHLKSDPPRFLTDSWTMELRSRALDSLHILRAAVGKICGTLHPRARTPGV